MLRFSGFDALLRHWADVAPDAAAIRYAEGGALCLCSHAELLARVQARAKSLRRETAAAYALFMDGSLACVIETFASVLAGRRTVLLNENAPDAVLDAQLREAEVDALWGAPDLCESFAPLCRAGAEAGERKVLFFTSGTTSRAKAVVLTDETLCASAYNGGALLPLQAQDVLLNLLPLDHVFGFVCGLLWGLSCGATVALGRGARYYTEDCGLFRPTALSAVPLLLGFLLKQRALNPELKLLLVGAGECPPAVLQAAKATGARVCFGYGLTETSSGVALSLGEDPYAMTVCPDDRITIAPDGEVLIEAPTCIMQGYWRREDDTARAVQNGVLHTGDLGRLDEAGKLRLTGRKKEILVLADGTKLFLPEYEAAVAGALGETDLCILLRGGAPVLLLGGPPRDTRPLWDALRPVLEERPRGQQLRRILFYHDPLPRTASGKIMRWAIQREKESE
ncbi:MAG: acyl--CoA ligase [Oscillospiraceae bacterium]|nr:acyl--CoA ligase [Oscillospiraceae bacterium]